MSDRQPYEVPVLTRIVLQATQAVLSVCSAAAILNGQASDGSGDVCMNGLVHINASGSQQIQCTKYGIGDSAGPS